MLNIPGAYPVQQRMAFDSLFALREAKRSVTCSCIQRLESGGLGFRVNNGTFKNVRKARSGLVLGALSRRMIFKVTTLHPQIQILNVPAGQVSL